MKTIFQNGVRESQTNAAWRMAPRGDETHRGEFPDTEKRLLMRTKLCRLVMAAVLWIGFAAHAQTAAPPPKAGDTTINLDKMAAVSSNPLGVATNLVDVISLDPDLPLDTVIKSLASDAKLQFRYTPELMPNDRPAPVLAPQWATRASKK